MDNTICYLNTDLDLISAVDLSALAAALETCGVFPLHVSRVDDGQWRATFETKRQFTEPESNIAAMLTAVESLTKSMRAAWAACKLRDFNIGYDCGVQPWAFNQGLSSELLWRMAKAGASMRITLYPDRTPVNTKSPKVAKKVSKKLAKSTPPKSRARKTAKPIRPSSTAKKTKG